MLMLCNLFQLFYITATKVAPNISLLTKSLERQMSWRFYEYMLNFFSTRFCFCSHFETCLNLIDAPSQILQPLCDVWQTKDNVHSLLTRLFKTRCDLSAILRFQDNRFMTYLISLYYENACLLAYFCNTWNPQCKLCGTTDIFISIINYYELICF